VELRQPSDAPAVDAVVSRAAYRIAQEALTNAGKHAPGAVVTVAVERPDDAVVVRVVNGAGGAPVEEMTGGYGLVGLRERVRTLDGRFRAEPRLDGGFLVEAVLPT
jgi:signal transduction histidine kinase